MGKLQARGLPAVSPWMSTPQESSRKGKRKYSHSQIGKSTLLTFFKLRTEKGTDKSFCPIHMSSSSSSWLDKTIILKIDLEFSYAWPQLTSKIISVSPRSPPPSQWSRNPVTMQITTCEYSSKNRKWKMGLLSVWKDWTFSMRTCPSVSSSGLSSWGF